MCEGATITVNHNGANIPVGSSVDWYLGLGTGFNPYVGEGTLIGSVPVSGDPCNNPPQVLYIMVNPDNAQVGGSGDQCDEFMVLWTGSGGFSTDDILVTNLGPGTFQWDDFIAGNASSYSCGVPLPPGPVPPNAILIIQSHITNNVFVNSDVLCASGLPVYIISYSGTMACTGGYFDNNSPCSSCPVDININGSLCMFSMSPNYNPPSSSIDGWGWSNMGSGVYANVVPPVSIPAFVPPQNTIPPFSWTVPANFCEVNGMGDWHITGILNPPPIPGCPNLFTPYFVVNVSCPTMTLSGGGDVCEGNCPDSPTEISFTLSGGDYPFTADIVVSASLFPPFPINGLPITNGQTISVCLEGLFPSFNPATGVLNVPVLAIGLTATVQVVSLTSNSGCPVEVNPNSIMLHFIGAPSANAGNNQTICAHESVSLSGSMGGSASQSMWSTNGDGTFANPQNLNTTYNPGPSDISNGQVILTLSTIDVNGVCIPAESMITVTINPSLLIEVNTPLTICDNDIAEVIAMVTGGTSTLEWETTGDGVFADPFASTTFYTPGTLDIFNGTVMLSYLPVNSGVCIENAEPLILTIVAAPDVSFPQSVEICDQDSAVININIQGAFTNVTWSTSGDGILQVESNTMVTYWPGPMDISNQFTVVSVTIQSSFAVCGLITYNISVFITACDCPDFELHAPPSPLCAVADVLDLSSLLDSGGAGTWSISNTPSGSNPATLSGSIFTTADSDPGIYTVTYTLNNPEPGCPVSRSELITVRGIIMPEAGQNMAFCGAQLITLTGVLNPPVNLSVLWETLGDGIFANNTSLSTTYAPGPGDSIASSLILVLHSMDSICGNQSDSVTMFFNIAPTVELIGDTMMICNAEDMGSFLNFFSLIIAGDATGTWTNTSAVPVDFSNPASVNFDGIAEGYYVFHYETNSAMSPCSNVLDSIVVSVEECLCPLIMSQNVPDGVCNSLMSLPLNAFISAGAPGSWQIIGTPPGSNPGTLLGSVFLIDGCDPGEYQFRFTFDAAPIDGCLDSAEISIFIQEQATLSISGDTSICGQTNMQLAASIGGSALGISWSTGGSGIFSNASSLNPIYSPSASDLLAGQILITATTTDTLGFCTVPIKSFILSLITPPRTDFSSLNATLCNNPDSITVINLFSYITSGDISGIWADMDGAMVNLSNPANVDFAGVPPGIYRLGYTTQSAALPCTDTTYTFTITLNDCACPVLQILQNDLIVCETFNLDLPSLLVMDVAPGIWNISNGPPGGSWPLITGNTLNGNNVIDGDYTLRYTLIDSVPGCPASVQIAIRVLEDPTINISSVDCAADEMSYTVSLFTSGETITANLGVVSQVSPGSFLIENIPIDQNVLIQAQTNPAVCIFSLAVFAPNCSCTLMLEDIADTLRLCPGDTFILIPLVTGAQGLPFATWVTPTGSKMQPTLPLHTPGQYIWIVKDSLGCEERDTFNAIFIGPVSAEVTSISPLCPGDTDGQLLIESIENGSGPFMIQLDNRPPVVLNQFPLILDQVATGNHLLLITDIIGCTLQWPVQVISQNIGVLDLGPDVRIQKGDSTFIKPVTNGIPIQNATWNIGNVTTGITPFWYGPQETTLVIVDVVDSIGCTYNDSILITVYETVEFYIPTIFSPNGDQINDILLVHTNLPNDQLISLEIFDRWGNMIYRQQGNAPLQWNGHSKNKLVMSGVYVYKITWEDEKQSKRIVVGDVTVVR